MIRAMAVLTGIARHASQDHRFRVQAKRIPVGIES